MALEGADRAAKLTYQLLAFSRRQPLLPSDQDLNRVVHDMVGLVTNALAPKVDLKLELSDQPASVVVDRVQAENAILNLAINSRDAASEGGTCTISTEVTPAETILRVSDTGCGMVPETVARF